MSEWKECALNEIADVIMGQSPSSSTYNDLEIGMPFLQGCGDFGNRVPQKKYYCTVPKKVAPCGAILISVRAPVGITNIADSEYCIGRGLAAIVAKEADQDFLEYKVISSVPVLERVSQGSTFAAINTSDLNLLRLNCPPLPEQRKIARILSTVDAVIEKTEASIAKYKAIKQGMMHDLFTRGLAENGRLRPRYEDAPHLYKQTELGWVPLEWEVFSIADSNVQIVDGDRGANYPHGDELQDHGYCLFLSATNVTANGFVFQSKQFITQEKDFLMGSGKLERHDVLITTRGTVGNIAYFADTITYENIRINSGMLILRNKDEDLLPEFLYYSFNNYLFNIDFQRIVSGSAQPQLPMKDLKKFRIIKPRKDEQQRVISACLNYEKLIQKEQSTLNKMQTLKSGLMFDLLTGTKQVITDSVM